MSERLPSIDGDISSGAVVFGNPEKKARLWLLMSAHSLIRNGLTSRTCALETYFKSYVSGLEGKIFY